MKINEGDWFTIFKRPKPPSWKKLKTMVSKESFSMGKKYNLPPRVVLEINKLSKINYTFSEGFLKVLGNEKNIWLRETFANGELFGYAQRGDLSEEYLNGINQHLKKQDQFTVLQKKVYSSF